MTSPPRIPRPPSKEDLDQVSQEQALLADEWAPEATPVPRPKNDPENANPGDA